MRQDLGLARETLKMALGMQPEHESAYSHLALAHVAAGETHLAMQELNRLLLINPENLKARVDLGVFELVSANLDAALQQFQEALKRSPDHGKALYYKAMVFYQHGKKAPADRILRALS